MLVSYRLLLKLFQMISYWFIRIRHSYTDFSGKYSAIFRHNIAIKTDERGRMMNEIIVGMRVIKMYAWEKPFSMIIDKIRRYSFHLTLIVL